MDFERPMVGVDIGRNPVWEKTAFTHNAYAPVAEVGIESLEHSPADYRCEVRDFVGCEGYAVERADGAAGQSGGRGSCVLNIDHGGKSGWLN